MDDERLTFLYGAGFYPAGQDLDDVEVRASLLQPTFPDDLPASRRLRREMVASHIYLDDPPEVWPTARRLMEAGLDREEVFTQLEQALGHGFRRLDDDQPFDRNRYADALDALPLPSYEDVEDAAIELVRAAPGILADDLDDTLAEHFGRKADDDLFGDLLGEVLDPLFDGLGPLEWVAGDRTVHVGDLTAGIVLTRRVTDVEQRIGALTAAFDLAGFARLDELSLPGGEEIEPFSAEPGHLAWRGPNGWLDRFEPGDLLAVRVDPDGTVDLTALADEPPIDPTLVERVRSAYDAEVAEPWLPVSAEDLVLALQLEDPSTFATPRPPLAELCAGAGLERRMDEVAHEESVWQAARQSARIGRLYSRIDDQDLIRTVLRVLGVADVVAGIPADQVVGLDGHEGPVDAGELRSVLADLADMRVLAHVAIELFEHADPDTGRAGNESFLTALLDAASKPWDVAAAHYLATLDAERSLDPIEAERHLERAVQADPEYLAAIDRLAWYASDRGDASKAARLWQMLERDKVRQDLVEVEPVAQSAGREPGRNEPCWCGSGRKYKQCHLRTGGGACLPPLPDRVGWLCRKAVAFLERRADATAEDMFEIAGIIAGDPDDHEALNAAFGEPIVADLVLHELGWFDEFLAERGPLLPEDEALLAQSWRLVDRTVYEVEGADPGRTLTLRDVRTGDVIEVRERTLSQQVAPPQLLCGRAVPDGQSHQLIGGVIPVTPGTEERLVEALDERDPYEIAGYQAALRRPPVLTTREGEATVECHVEFDVGGVAAGLDSVRAFLGEEYEPDPDQPDRWIELFPINDDENIVRAHLSLEGERIHVETTSEERADRVMAAVITDLPGVRVVRDERTPLDVAAMLAEAKKLQAEGGRSDGLALPGLGGGPAPADDPDLAAAMEQFLDMMERRWCDEQIPALGGRTPREAAGDPTRRHELERLIASFESFAAGPGSPAGGGGFRPARLRELLGLDGPGGDA